MSNEMKSVPREDRIAAMLLHYEVERFYYDEAALLDSHRYDEWLALFSDDAHYFMPIRRTRMQRELDKELPSQVRWRSSMTPRRCSPGGSRSSNRAARGLKTRRRARAT